MFFPARSFFKKKAKSRKKKLQNINLPKDFLLKLSNQEIETVLSGLKTSTQGLSEREVQKRLKKYGKNNVAHEKPPAWYFMLLSNFKNPFVLVLLLLGFVSFITGDTRATIVVLFMVGLSILMRFIQEFRSSQAAESLRKMVQTSATVKRCENSKNFDNQADSEGKNKPGENCVKREIPIEEIVPGDIIFLAAGDMVPADLRLIFAKDLFINQAALSGESVPVEKNDFSISEGALQKSTETKNPLERNNLCFMGTSVVSGFAEGIAVATGNRTFFGSLAQAILGYRTLTSFDKGINKVTLLLIRFIAIMVPIIFLINGIDKQDWKEAFLFAIAVAVGLTPEMLPMIVTANLAKGAVAMSRLKVIVKKLNAIQSFGAMNVLCTDKTGTLTQDKMILERYLDVNGEEQEDILNYGYLNSYFQSGLKNMLDRAVLEHAHVKKTLNIQEDYKKIDEIPFDFLRKRISVVLNQETEKNILICKGSLEELLKVCSLVKDNSNTQVLSSEYIEKATLLADELSNEGFRVVGLAKKELPLQGSYSVKDENELIFMGLMAFLDPPKESAQEAIKSLKHRGIRVIVLTGDNDKVTKYICKQVDLEEDGVVLGQSLEAMSDEELSKVVETTNIFARLTPLQKARIIKILQANDHVVGYLGDGINDAPALKEADIGISVDTASDIARESADIILLEKSLLVLGEGVIKGREVYGNIIKYIKMTTSSNFGNVLSILVASSFLPFLPMLPLQLIIQNLFYDFSQLSIPWDHMDEEFLRKARPWDARGIARFMLCIGPISSLFDVTTFLLLWYVFKANTPEVQSLFQTGWFVEGLLSQTLIVHMIRTKKIPFFQSTATLPIIITTALVAAMGLYLPFSGLGATLQFVPLPDTYFIWLFLTLLSYCVLTQLVKIWYIKRFKAWL